MMEKQKLRVRLRTRGRMPRVAEMLRYYRRQDVLSFIYRYTLSRPVAMVFSEVMSHSVYTTSIIKPKSPEELLEMIEEGVSSRRYEANDRPVNYISFHQVLWSPFSQNDDPFKHDIVFEADIDDGYRASLNSLKVVVRTLEDFGVPYRIKFSGARSSKVIIRREVFPKDISSRFSGKYGVRLRRKLCSFLTETSVDLEQPPAIRIPYSLNELTGLVSLPIEVGDMDSFKPWWANPYVVTVDESWYDIPGDAQDRFARLLDFVLRRDEGLPKRRSTGQSRRKSASPRVRISARPAEEIRRMLESPDDSVRAEAAWELMLSENPDPEAVSKSLEDPSSDVRWFATEALARSDMPDRVERLIRMLNDEDDFVKGSAADGIGSIGIEAALHIIRKLAGGGHICYLPKGLRLALRAFDENVRSELWNMAESDPTVAKGILIAWRAFSQKHNRYVGNKLLELVEGHLPSIDDHMKAELLSELLCRFFYHEEVREKAARLMKEIDPSVSSAYIEKMGIDDRPNKLIYSGFRGLLSKIGHWF